MNEDLYSFAQSNNIDIDTVPLEHCESFALDIGSGCIVINPENVKNGADERVKLAHELGHCINGAFYNTHSPLDNRSKKEIIANRWAIKRLVPKAELENAIKNGFESIWELAEYFNVTEDFIRMAAEYYKTDV